MIKSRFVNSVLVLAPIATSFALLGSVLAGYLDPNISSIPAFLGLAFPFLFIIHLFSCVVYFVLTRRRLAILFVIPILASLNIFISFFGINFFPTAGKNGKDPFVFMTYNVHYFQDRENQKVYIDSSIIRLVKEEKSDIVCFQDFTISARRDKTIDSIKKNLGLPYFYCGPEKEDEIPNNEMSIFSRFPIVNSGFVVLASERSGNQCLFVDVKKGDKIFRVYNVHLQSLKFSGRDYERWDEGNAKNKASFLKHNFRRLQYAFTRRSNQVKIMKEEMANCPFPYIVAGDFNDSPASYAVNEMSRGIKNTFRERAKGYKVTYNGDMPNFQIDYILTEPTFKVNSYEVIESELSDHYPVKTILSL